MRTADDDSGPVPHETFTLPRAVLVLNRPAPRRPAPRGGVWIPRRDELAAEDTLVSPMDSRSGARTSARAASDSSDDEPTVALQTPILPRPPEPAHAAPDARASGPLDAALAGAAKLWGNGALRTTAAVAGAVLVTYLAVGGARRERESSVQMMMVGPPATRPAVAPITVEQLNGALPSPEVAPLRGEPSNKASRRSAGSRARAATVAATPVSPTSTNEQQLAPAQSQPTPRRVERSSKAVSSGSAGLPAWGADAVRDFSSGNSSAGASVAEHAQARAAEAAQARTAAPAQARTAEPAQAGTAKPVSSSTGAPPTTAVARPPAAPVAVAAKPAEPPTPVAPPPPSKPLTMEQLLNRVEEVARAQQKQVKAPKTSKRDAELDELINGAMQSKK